ncbi:hypothetical protein D3C72_1228920 [compost metagenome]
MKYYKNPEGGQVFAYAADGSDDEFIGADLVLMDDAEVALHLYPEAAAPTRAMIEAERLRAYADPLTGSDRHFAEAQRESLLGNAENAETAKRLGLERFAEIQAEYPWPDEDTGTAS